MLGHRGCRLGITYPEITEMQARAIFEAVVQVAKKGKKVIPEVMIPLIGGVQELSDQKAIVKRVAEEVLGKAGLKNQKYMIGTMIEIPRAALTADKVAAEAEFFSFGTNDLTQTTMGLSRDDYVKFSKDYEDKKIFKADPFAVLDQEGVGKLVEMGVKLGRATQARIWKSASAASTAASPARWSSATGWGWTTCPAPRTACRSRGWRRRRRPWPATRPRPCARRRGSPQRHKDTKLKSKGGGESSHPFLLFRLAGDPFSQEHLQQGLVRHVPLVCQNLQVVNHGSGQPDGDRLQRRLQVRQRQPLRLFPVKVGRRVVRRPEARSLVLARECWQSFSHNGRYTFLSLRLVLARR